MSKVIVGFGVAGVGVVLGLILGLYAIQQYIVSNYKVEAYSVSMCGLEPIATCGHLDDIEKWQRDAPLLVVRQLKVVNNYGEQKTANVHVLEPKVSDAYYQWGANPQIVGLNQ